MDDEHYLISDSDIHRIFRIIDDAMSEINDIFLSRHIQTPPWEIGCEEDPPSELVDISDADEIPY